jgi:hypothetical protein
MRRLLERKTDHFNTQEKLIDPLLKEIYTEIDAFTTQVNGALFIIDFKL